MGRIIGSEKDIFERVIKKNIDKELKPLRDEIKKLEKRIVELETNKK